MKSKGISDVLPKEGLRMHSLRISREALKGKEVYVLRMPRTLKEYFKKLGEARCSRKGKGFPDKKKYIPSAMKAFRKLVSLEWEQVLWVAGSLGEAEKNDGVWIVSTESFDLAAMGTLCNRWLKQERSVLEENFEKPEAIDWGSFEKIELSEFYTPERIYPLLYQLLPQYYAHQIAKKEIYMDTLHTTMHFHRVMSGDGVVLIDDPFFYDPSKKKYGRDTPAEKGKERYEPFSYYVKLTVSKLITEEELSLNISLHTRLWSTMPLVQNKINYVSGQEATSIYMQAEATYRESKASVWQKLMITRKMVDHSEKEKDYVAERVFLTEKTIDLQAILEQEGALRKSGEMMFLVTSKRKDTRFKRGSGLKERCEIFSRIGESLSELSEKGPYPKCAFRKHPLESAPRFLGDEKEIQLLMAVQKQTDREKIKAQLCRMFNLRIWQDSIPLPENKNLSICFIENDFTQKLDEAAISSSRIERIDLLKNRFEKSLSDRRTMVLIDMKNYAKEQNAEEWKEDPKALIRAELGKMGIVTQFIDLHDKEDSPKVIEGKIKNSLYDLFASGGSVYEKLFSEKGKIFTGDIDGIYAVGKINVGESKSLAAACKLDQNEVVYHLFQPEQKDAAWKTTSEIVKKISAEKVTCLEFSDKTVGERIKSRLLQDLSEMAKTHRKILVIMDWSLRKQCPLFQNDPFDKILQEVNDSIKDKVVFVRVNTSHSEIPEYEIFSRGSTINRCSGLFRQEGKESTFWYVPARPDQVQVNKNAVKLENPGKMIPKQRLVELSIRCTDEDKLPYAKSIVQLMGATMAYSGETSYPMPLHLLRQFSQYEKARNDAAALAWNKGKGKEGQEELPNTKLLEEE